MICCLMEIALEDASQDNNKLINSITCFLLIWSSKHLQLIGTDDYALELLVRLGNRCTGFSNTLATLADFVPASIQRHNHSARSVLSMAGSVSVVRVHECGIMFEDISTVVFSSRPIEATTAQIHQNFYANKRINMCLLEEGTFEFFLQTCKKMQWKEILILQADIGSTTAELLPTSFSTAPIDSTITISVVDLDFNRPIHAINVTPIVQQILSFATVEDLQFRNASISDLNSALSDHRLKDTITRVELKRISIPNDDNLSKTGRTLTSFTCLAKLSMVECVLGGSQLISLLSELKRSTTFKNLRLIGMLCLEENRTFEQFCSLLTDWSNMQELQLDNNLSVEQIGHLLKAIKSLTNLTYLDLRKIPNLRQEHVDALKSSNPELKVITG